MMRDAHPLLFLVWKSAFNGAKRSLTTPRRLIGVLGALLYYTFFFIRPFSRNSEFSGMGQTAPITQFPEATYLNPLVFTVFMLASFPMVLGLLSYRGGFKPADIDVLFPTPVSPKVVLGFRVIRDYMVALLLPLMVAVLGMRPLSAGMMALFTGFPRYGVYAGKSLVIGWLMVSLCWVSMGYATSLFVGRSDLKSDRNRWLLIAGVGMALAIPAIFVASKLRGEITLDGVRDIVNSPVMRIPFFVASLATWVVMAPITENWILGWVGLAGLVGVVAGSLKLALTQVEWLYDQAAAKGFSSVDIRQLQKRGDTYGIYAEQARKGKLRRNRLSAWISKWNFRGPIALLWKDALLQVRTSIWSYVILLPLFIILWAVPIQLGVSSSGRRAGILFLASQALAIFILTAGMTQTSFIEMLKRVDFLKPLPFTPMVTVFYEVVGKVIPGVVILTALSAGALGFAPSQAPVIVASIIMCPGVATALTALVLVISLLFPDFDDPTQRSFRNLMMLLGFAIVGSPTVAIVGIGYALKVNPILYSLPVLIVNAAIALGLSVLSGTLYATYNPSE